MPGPAERGSPKFEKAELRWLERYLSEGTPRLQHLRRSQRIWRGGTFRTGAADSVTGQARGVGCTGGAPTFSSATTTSSRSSGSPGAVRRAAKTVDAAGSASGVLDLPPPLGARVGLSAWSRLTTVFCLAPSGVWARFRPTQELRPGCAVRRALLFYLITKRPNRCAASRSSDLLSPLVGIDTSSWV